MAITDVVRLTLWAALTFLVGCGVGAQDPVWQTLQRAMSQAGTSADAKVPVDEQQDGIRRIVAEHRPAEPLLMMTLPGRDAVATLARVERDEDLSILADASGITVTLDRGVVVQTRGLGHDLMASDISGFRAARAGAGPLAYTRVTRRLSAEGVLLRHAVTCRLERAPDRITEICEGEARYENWYATDEHAASRQWLGPSLGYLYIERLN